MNSSAKLPDHIDTANTELLSLIPRISVLPDEDPLLLEDIRSAFLWEFEPVTAYERALVEDLVSLEWEMLRERRLRDLLIISEFRKVASEAFSKQEQSPFDWPAGPQDRADAMALTGPDPEAQARAEARLSEMGLSRGELVADTYRRLGKEVETHNRTLGDLERRRDRLREQFDRLKSSRVAAQTAIGEVEDITVEGD